MADSAEAEIDAFLRAYSLEEIANNKDARTALRAALKRYRGILILHAGLQGAMRDKLKFNDADKFVEYFDEMASDYCQSIFLAAQGFYKPSYLILRSGVENAVRCLAFRLAVPMTPAMPIHELFKAVRKAPFIMKNAECDKTLTRLTNLYSWLCDYVHTSNKSNMSNTRFAGLFPRFIAEETKRFEKSCVAAMVGTLGLFYLTLKDATLRLHHRERDTLVDLLPASTRKAFNTI